jgi:rubrerythrin
MRFHKMDRDNRVFYPDSAELYSSECSRDDVLEYSTNSVKSDETEDEELTLYLDLSIDVTYHCSVCGVCTDDPHTIGCPYYCFWVLLKHYKKI